jgi:hypothetical protein
MECKWHQREECRGKESMSAVISVSLWKKKLEIRITDRDTDCNSYSLPLYRIPKLTATTITNNGK